MENYSTAEKDDSEEVSILLAQGAILKKLSRESKKHIFQQIIKKKRDLKNILAVHYKVRKNKFE